MSERADAGLVNWSELAVNGLLPTGTVTLLLPTSRPHAVRLLSDGLTNNDIATRLFVSPRTVQTNLTHVYTRLSLSSRVQLAQEAAMAD